MGKSSKKNPKDLNLKERTRIMEDYHSGDEKLKAAAIEEMVMALDEYIYYMIHQRFSGYLNMIDDLAQSGRMAIIEKMENYNPEYKLTTYFSYHIQNALQEIVNKENGESHYYAESKNIIVKTIRKLGMDVDNIDEQLLAMHLNMTVGRLHSILEKTLYKKKVELIEEDMKTCDVFDNPESTFIQDETKREFRNCINLLEEEEQIVLCMHFGFYYPKFNEMQKMYKLSDIQKALDVEGYNVNAINKYRSARRHIADILYEEGLIKKRNRYQNAKEDIGFRFKNDKEAMDVFESLNALPDESIV